MKQTNTTTVRLNFFGLTSRVTKAMLLLLVSTLFMAKESSASHFRYGHLTWAPVSGTTARFTLVDAFRRVDDPPNEPGYPGSAADGFTVVGDTITETIGGTRIDFGDGSFTPILRYVVISVDPTHNWIVARALDPLDPSKTTIDHTYATENNGGNPWLAEINTCCRTDGELNNPDVPYRVSTLVDLTDGNISPSSSLPPIVNLVQSTASTFIVPVTDPDANTTLTFRLATSDEAGGTAITPFNQPTGLTIDPVTGVVTWNTLVNAVLGGLYSCQVIIEDHNATTGALKTRVAVDFLIYIVTCSPTNRTPDFIGLTPADGSTLTVQENSPVSFTVQASDSDATDSVTINAAGPPSGSTFTPGLPTTGNPISSVFNWTPSIGSAGNYIVSFSAADQCGATLLRSVTIHVTSCSSPQVTCPGNVTVNISNSTCHGGPYGCSAIVNYPPATATGDPAPVITYSQNSGTSFSKGTTVVTATATNSCGSTSCTFNVKVVDNVFPVANCRNATVTLVNGTATITAAQINNGSYDNCGIASMTVSPNTFNCSSIGCKRVTLTVTDSAGNSSTCCANVTVVGALPRCSISLAPCNNTYTGGNSNKIYLGYGPQSVTLNVTVTGGGAPYSYAWTGSYLSGTTGAHPVFAPTSAGSYPVSVIVTNSNGCTTTCSVTFCVMDIRVPGTSGSGQKVYLCHQYSCSPTNYSLLVSQVPSHMGCHSLDKLGKCNQLCGSARTAEEGEMLIGDENSEMEMVVYPNPFNNNFHIRFENAGDEKINVRLFNIAGQTLQTLTDQMPDQDIVLGNDLGSGIYFLEIQQGDFRKVVKVNKAE